ncbi:MAG: hypothetical protein EA342_00535 [Leptolyngbya sp. LCM1.Bin17]|nr:MAG: hypothetical protein EA342_00535 [Leptolyngbya sp. LCM1.Bin17]
MPFGDGLDERGGVGAGRSMPCSRSASKGGRGRRKQKDEDLPGHLSGGSAPMEGEAEPQGRFSPGSAWKREIGLRSATGSVATQSVGTHRNDKLSSRKNRRNFEFFLIDG